MRRREPTGSRRRRPSLTSPRRGRTGSRAAYQRLSEAPTEPEGTGAAANSREVPDNRYGEEAAAVTAAAAAMETAAAATAAAEADTSAAAAEGVLLQGAEVATGVAATGAAAEAAPGEHYLCSLFLLCFFFDLSCVLY